MKFLKIILLVLLLPTMPALYAEDKAKHETDQCTLTPDNCITNERAQALFNYFKTSDLFIWPDKNNCEDRAEAVCRILNKWQVACYKVWIFNGRLYNKVKQGTLIEGWKFHVAAAVPVLVDGAVQLKVIDPATLESAVSAAQWAEKVTEMAGTHYLATVDSFYMYKKVNGPNWPAETCWNKRDETNYKYTMQGLAGINGVGAGGPFKIWKARHRIAALKARFEALVNIGKPVASLQGMDECSEQYKVLNLGK